MANAKPRPPASPGAVFDLNARNAAKGAPELSARIGLESGPVVVDSTGEVFGDAPNVAARVLSAAEPGSVLVTLNVQRQVAGLFVAEEQGAHELKGVSGSVQLFRIIRASSGRRRGGARTLTQFVGREEELVLLARRWERARAGEGQLVLVVGEPGLGKSRLIEEFHTRLAETPHSWVEWSASQLLQNTPLHPIVEWGRQRFGLDVPAEQRLADLEDTLRLIGLDPAEHAPLLAPLVDIPLLLSRVAGLPSEELRRRQLAAVTAWVLAGARSQPVVLAFEDLHWAELVMGATPSRRSGHSAAVQLSNTALDAVEEARPGNAEVERAEAPQKLQMMRKTMSSKSSQEAMVAKVRSSVRRASAQATTGGLRVGAVFRIGNIAGDVGADDGVRGTGAGPPSALALAVLLRPAAVDCPCSSPMRLSLRTRSSVWRL